MSEQDTRTKRTQSQTRAKVEHPFLTLKHIWGHAQGGLSGLAQERQAGVCDAGLDPYGAMGQTMEEGIDAPKMRLLGRNDPPRLVLRHGLARSPELTRVPIRLA